MFVLKNHELALWEETWLLFQPRQSISIPSLSSVLRNPTITSSYQSHPPLSPGIGPPRPQLEQHILPLWCPMAYPQTDLEFLCRHKAGAGGRPPGVLAWHLAQEPGQVSPALGLIVHTLLKGSRGWTGSGQALPPCQSL